MIPISSGEISEPACLSAPQALRLYVIGADGFHSATSLEDAARKLRSLIQANGWGARDCGGANVYGLDGKPVATISYNGRVWPPNTGAHESSEREALMLRRYRKSLEARAAALIARRAAWVAGGRIGPADPPCSHSWRSDAPAHALTDTCEVCGEPRA